MDHSPPTCTCRLHIFGTGEFLGESSATVALLSVTILLEGVVLETVPSVVAGLSAGLDGGKDSNRPCWCWLWRRPRAPFLSLET